MPTDLPTRRGKRKSSGLWLLLNLICVAALVAVVIAINRYGVTEFIARFDLKQNSVVRPGGGSTGPDGSKLPQIIRPGSGTGTASDGTRLPEIIRPGATPNSSTIISLPHPRHIQVVDGDTIHADGKSYRLVGIDAPESGLRAKCAAEREKAARATKRLREIVAGGSLSLNRVSCNCAPGTEGTEKCNYGRFCGVLTSAGRDVGQMLITEGLANRYDCSSGHCPPKKSWCL